MRRLSCLIGKHRPGRRRLDLDDGHMVTRCVNCGKVVVVHVGWKHTNECLTL